MKTTLEKTLPFAVFFALSCGQAEPDTTPDNDPPPSCSTFDEASCADQPGCIPIRGKRFDASNACLEPESFITC